MSSEQLISHLNTLGTIIAMATGIAGFILGWFGFKASKLSAMTEFFLRGDSEEIADAKNYVFAKAENSETFDATDKLASRVASHYEFWGKMQKLGYLPLNTFEGASGITMINLYTILYPFIEKRRRGEDKGGIKNLLYAKNFENLKGTVERKYKYKQTVY